MGSIIDGLDDHEGYAARHRSGATVIVTAAEATSAFDAYVAACGCGWRGGGHAATEDGHERAVEEWERVHATPLLARTVPAEVRQMIRDLTKGISQLIEDRPIAGLEALRTLADWADAIVVRVQRLPPTSRPQPQRGRSLGR